LAPVPHTLRVGLLDLRVDTSLIPWRQETQFSEEEAVPDKVAYDLFEKVEVVVDPPTVQPRHVSLVARVVAFASARASAEEALCEAAYDLFEKVEVRVNPSGSCLHHDGVTTVGRSREVTPLRRRVTARIASIARAFPTGVVMISLLD
jgi:hypothetical protein